MNQKEILLVAILLKEDKGKWEKLSKAKKMSREPGAILIVPALWALLAWENVYQYQLTAGFGIL